MKASDHKKIVARLLQSFEENMYHLNYDAEAVIGTAGFSYDEFIISLKHQKAFCEARDRYMKQVVKKLPAD